ncbi:MAG: epimerase [Bacteroidia bacterium]|nr:epimerase [Bacteroidia bacterium]
MKVIITGTTGMIGEGVLLECLKNPAVTHILSVSRKLPDIIHPRLQHYVVKDFLSLSENDPRLSGYDACFYCAGVSSVGMSEADYKRITYDTTLHFARALNPGPGMSFIYISGGGTDSTEKGRMMWARIKGRTENDLMKLPFRQVFGFRIGFVKASEGQKRLPAFYRYISWLFPLVRVLLPGIYSTMKQVTGTMIYLAANTYPHSVIYVKDIHKISKYNYSPYEK